MSSACPTCGVAVVPGYVKCPKCGASLMKKHARLQTNTAGGTSMEGGGGFPVLPVAGAAVAVAVIIAVIAMRSGDSKAKATEAAPAGDDRTDTGPATTTGDTDEPDPTPDPTPPQPSGPDPSAAAAELRGELQRERLWGTVEATPPRVDVRSGGCDDPKMPAVLDASAPALRSAGLTKLRCLEQSGRVVFERDL